MATDLDWHQLGALPQVLQTAWGSMTVGMDLPPGGTVLIRGGTSSVGLMTAVLAKRRGATVLSTTRRPDRAAALCRIGVDHVLIDDGNVTDAVREIVAEGVDGAIELVGARRSKTRSAPVDRAVRRVSRGSFIPSGVRLTARSRGRTTTWNTTGSPPSRWSSPRAILGPSN
ncbi:MAG: zinc-binding dehydrogenase [Nannocystales bacterium]